MGKKHLEHYRPKVWKYWEGKDRPTKKAIAQLLGISESTVGLFLREPKPEEKKGGI